MLKLTANDHRQGGVLWAPVPPKFKENTGQGGSYRVYIKISAMVYMCT